MLCKYMKILCNSQEFLILFCSLIDLLYLCSLKINKNKDILWGY